MLFHLGGGAGITISSCRPRWLLCFPLQTPAMTSVPTLTRAISLLWLDSGPSISISVPAQALWAIGWNSVRGLFNLHPQNHWAGATELHRVNKRVGSVDFCCDVHLAAAWYRGLKDWMNGQFKLDWLNLNVALMELLADAKEIDWSKLTLSYFKYFYNFTINLQNWPAVILDK